MENCPATEAGLAHICGDIQDLAAYKDIRTDR
jgi:hypothetical protein